MKRELRISEDSAQAQLELFFDWYGMDYEEVLGDGTAATDKNRAARAAVKKLLVQRLRQGYMEFKEEDQKDGASTLVAMQHLDREVHGKTEIKYNEITGRHRAAVKIMEGENETAQMYNFLGVLTGEGKSFFDSLRGADIGVADVMGYLFLLV